MSSVLRSSRPQTELKSAPHLKIGVWLFIFFLLGLGLRITNLDLKTAWMDEVSTVIFSLGNSSYLLPTEKIVGLTEFLQPITAHAEATSLDSARYLLQENNHPPAYFMLAHFWMDLFSRDGEVASLVVSRLFSAFWGALAIPIIFWATKSAFQSSRAGLFSAAFMAVSPFSIFLSQEARHYGLAIALIGLSMGCFAISTRSVLSLKVPDWKTSLVWILVNAFAFANHYFSALTFAAQALVLGAIAWQQIRQNGLAIMGKSYWKPIYLVASATAISVFAWLPVLLNFHGSPQTTFLRENDGIMRWINPPVQMFAGVITSFFTPANFFAQKPFEFLFIGISILLTLALIAIFVPALIKGIRFTNQSEKSRIGLFVVNGFLVAMVGLFAFICYVYGSDITRGLRYQFTYYPALLMLAGGVFDIYWQGRSPDASSSVRIPLTGRRVSGKGFVQIFWVVGLLSALMVIHNLAFPKYYAPDRFIPFIQSHSTHPIAIASTEEVFEQPTVIGAKFLSIGWEIERHFPIDAAESGWKSPPRFFAIREGYGIDTSVTKSFQAVVNRFEDPIDLWVIRSEIDENDPLIKAKPPQCSLDETHPQGNKGGYLYIHFICEKGLG